MDDHGQSDSPVVPAKSPNNAGRPAAEGMEGRGLAKGNPSQQNASRTQSRAGAPSALERVREVAQRDKTVRFSAPAPHLRRRASAGSVLRAAAGRGPWRGRREVVGLELRRLCPPALNQDSRYGIAFSSPFVLPSGPWEFGQPIVSIRRPFSGRKRR